MMQKPFFTGVCTALVTPFYRGEVNYPMLQQLLRFQMDAGIRTIVICGTTGEAPTLSDREKLELFRRAKDCVGENCQIIAGTGSNDTRHAVALSRAAEQTGVDGLLLVSPYYNKAPHEGLAAHYRAIAKAVDIPCILYNVPSRTGVDIPVSVYRQLSEIPNIAGVKEASGDIGKVSAILRECPGFTVWTGNDDQIVPAMALGARGVISVVSNLLPAKTSALTDAALDGDFDTAAALQLEMLPLIKALFSEVSPIPVKAAMEMIGFDCGPCRLPLTPMNEEKRRKLQQLLVLQ